jgi:hypothetical protein
MTASERVERTDFELTNAFNALDGQPSVLPTVIYRIG